MSVRTAGKRGRLPAKTGSDKLPIGWVHSYLTQPLPAPVYPVDVSGGITDFLMLGNGPDPSCRTIPTAWETAPSRAANTTGWPRPQQATRPRQWETSTNSSTSTSPTTTGRTSGRTSPTSCCSGTGRHDPRVRPRGPCRPGSRRRGHAGVPRRVLGSRPHRRRGRAVPAGPALGRRGGRAARPSDGHCIVKVAADGHVYDTWVTWGAVQRSTLAWTEACLTEAWVIITEEDAKAANLDIAALRADIDALHGTGGAAPAASPARARAHRTGRRGGRPAEEGPRLPPHDIL